MNKTKLGISVGLVGAALYFLGAISLIPAFLLAGYVLLFEENEWLKKTAVKMVVIIVCFSIASIGISMIQNVFSVINTMVRWVFSSASIYIPLNLDSLLRTILGFVENLILLILGFKALTVGSMKVGFIDKIVDKYF